MWIIKETSISHHHQVLPQIWSSQTGLQSQTVDNIDVHLVNGDGDGVGVGVGVGASDCDDDGVVVVMLWWWWCCGDDNDGNNDGNGDDDDGNDDDGNDDDDGDDDDGNDNDDGDDDGAQNLVEDSADLLHLCLSEWFHLKRKIKKITF